MGHHTFPPSAAWHSLVASAVEEDLGSGDVTSRIVIAAQARGHARIEARQDLVVCGLPIVHEVFRQIDPSLVLEDQVEDGKRVAKDSPLVSLSGRVRSILSGERTALNFLARMSGVATLTRRYVDATAGSSAAIVDTRKTLPGWRLLDKYAVATGGGVNHRIGLFDGILLKDNHIAAAGGVARAVENARQSAPANLRIQVEVESVEAAREACDAGADLLLLDNRSPDEIREIAAALPQAVVLEASGGITLDNVRDYAETGVQRISIGALTHSAPAVDLALEMEEEAAHRG